eukprot:1180818-Prorocentrum_minimum.AAC.2
MLSSPLRLVPTPGICSLVPCDWFQPLEYALCLFQVEAHAAVAALTAAAERFLVSKEPIRARLAAAADAATVARQAGRDLAAITRHLAATRADPPGARHLTLSPSWTLGLRSTRFDPRVAVVASAGASSARARASLIRCRLVRYDRRRLREQIRGRQLACGARRSGPAEREADPMGGVGACGPPDEDFIGRLYLPMSQKSAH